MRFFIVFSLYFCVHLVLEIVTENLLCIKYKDTIAEQR